ncbi:MAG: hypothetical protein RLY56_76 [Pseudomonadota bacterium]|jgi:pilus assembly protein CpaC
MRQPIIFFFAQQRGLVQGANMIKESGLDRIRFACILLALWMVCVSPLQAALPTRIDLFVGDSRVVDAEATRIAVGNGKVVSATLVSAGQFVLIGHAPGDTVVQLWLRDGTQRRLDVRVTTIDLQATLTEVQRLLGDVPGASARIAGGRILLEGEIVDARPRMRVSEVAKLFPEMIVDLTSKPSSETLVHVDVKIVEFRQGQFRELGIRWREDISGPSAGVIADFVTNDRFRFVGPETPAGIDAFDAIPGHTSAKAYLGIATTLESRLRMLEQSGEALTVAEPRLSCRSGGHARFVAGGEIPVPIVNSVGSTDVEFREYGVILDIKPLVETPGMVMLRVETEISQVDNAQRVAGIPGLLKRRSTTDIDLKHGDTVVIAGLMQRQRSRDSEGLPAVSRLPAVGRLFGVKGQRQDESEVVIFLTPRLESASTRSGDDAARLRRAQERIDSLGSSPRKTPERPAPVRSSELKGA